MIVDRSPEEAFELVSLNFVFYILQWIQRLMVTSFSQELLS